MDTRLHLITDYRKLAREKKAATMECLFHANIQLV